MRMLTKLPLLFAIIESGLVLQIQSCKNGCQSAEAVCICNRCVPAPKCVNSKPLGSGPPKSCPNPTDPNKKAPSRLETWFSKEDFDALFPRANLGWGTHHCLPYNYDAFVIATRYFPNFASEAPKNGLTAEENFKRDLSSFFAHAIQETGENDASLYASMPNKVDADACFYRGGLFNWFEGGPNLGFLPPNTNATGFAPSDGQLCGSGGRYCINSLELNHFYPCSQEKDGSWFKGCYFGRGPIQISYNFNYGQFQIWLRSQNISNVDLLRQPNLILTKTDPPLAVMASLWFYMTPQPPKPAMHDIILGQWEPGAANRKKGYEGPIFGPTSLVINNECGGEDWSDPGGPGESRRIKAFKWFTETVFGVKPGPQWSLTCKGMPKKLEQIQHALSWQPAWKTTWLNQSCDCAPAEYAGMIPYFQAGFYPQKFVDLNEANRQECVESMYKNPKLYSMSPKTSICLTQPL